MHKIKGIVDRIEESSAVVQTDLGNFLIPISLNGGLLEGDVLTIAIAKTSGDRKKLERKAEELIGDILKEE